MATVALVLAVVGLGVLVLAVLELRRLRRDLRELEARAGELAAEVDALPPELARTFGTRARHLVSVEILNLFELAHKESLLTRPFTVLTPRLMRDVVHRMIIGRVRQSLADAGVVADVRLHRAR